MSTSTTSGIAGISKRRRGGYLCLLSVLLCCLRLLIMTAKNATHCSLQKNNSTRFNDGLRTFRGELSAVPRGAKDLPRRKVRVCSCTCFHLHSSHLWHAGNRRALRSLGCPLGCRQYGVYPTCPTATVVEDAGLQGSMVGDPRSAPPTDVPS